MCVFRIFHGWEASSVAFILMVEEDVSRAVIGTMKLGREPKEEVLTKAGVVRGGQKVCEHKPRCRPKK